MSQKQTDFASFLSKDEQDARTAVDRVASMLSTHTKEQFAEAVKRFVLDALECKESDIIKLDEIVAEAAQACFDIEMNLRNSIKDVFVASSRIASVSLFLKDAIDETMMPKVDETNAKPS
jgi:2-phospho-L-lactate guanylyltransferase (CobY/MobA/RfbA family)